MDKKELLRIINEAVSEGWKDLVLHRQYISELPCEIGRIITLERLVITGNKLQSLPAEIENLVNLEILRVDQNLLTKLPSEIGNLKNLYELSATSNLISSLPEEIGNILNLRQLNVSYNKLISLPSNLCNLVNLTALGLKGNSLATLPKKMRNLSKLKTLFLAGNPLPIPPEIMDQYRKPLEILNYYFTHFYESKKRRLNEAKMILVGQGDVGKTCIVNRLIYNTFDERQGRTEGIDILEWNIKAGEEYVKLNIWDFGGQEIMHATHQFFMTERTLYLLVIDARKGEQESNIDYWLKLIQSFGGGSPIIVIVNQIDQGKLSVDKRGLQYKYENIKSFVETSCKNEEGIDELKEEISKQLDVMEHVRQEWIPNWFNVKTELEDIEDDLIPISKYKVLCDKYNVDDLSRTTLLRFLHDLGIILCFIEDIRLKDINILNPEWVTNGVYRIMNCESLLGREGILTLITLGNILNKNKYPNNTHPFLMEMMRKFELCFEFEGEKDKYLIPDLLPKEQPEFEWCDKDNLQFEYHYDVLPPSVMSRFIVRMHTYIKPYSCWRTGVILKNNGYEVLVKADLADKKISISITGNKRRRREFLAIIRSNFNHIHGTIAKITAHEKIPVPGFKDIWIDYSHLCDLEDMGEETIVPPGLKERLNVKQLLNGIESEEKRREKYDDEGGGHIRMGRLPPTRHGVHKPETKAKSPWPTGSFYLVTYCVLVILSALIGKFISWVALPVILVSSLLALFFITLAQLRFDDKTKDETFKELSKEALKRMVLLRGKKPFDT